MLQQIDIFFESKGALQKHIVDWLHTAMGFDLDVIQQTRFISAKKLPYHAQTFYKTVWYLDPTIETNATHRYTITDWLNMIAHEMYHRQEIGNNIISGSKMGLSYGFHWAKNYVNGKHPYHQNPHEIRAFEVGCSNDSKVNVWLREHPEFLMLLENRFI